MKQLIRANAGWMLYALVAGLVIALVIGAIAGFDQLMALLMGYLLSLFFVSSNFLIVRRLDTKDNRRFYRIFFATYAVRFILILACLLFVLGVTKIHQIYFTVSFIISYIFHSVIEVIFINRILETDI